MLKGFMTFAAAAMLAAVPLLADFSYQETSRITGGALASMMKVAGVFSKQARQANQPIQSTVAVKGDKMVHRDATSATVIDLDSQTITTIDLQKKTYYVMTFDEMKQMMQDMSDRMKQNKDQGEVKFNVSINPTGKTKQIDGLEAHEMQVKLTMTGTNNQNGQQGSMVVATDSWVAADAAGYAEVRSFHQRMAEKLNWTPGGEMFMNRPDVQRGMAEAEKESAKMDGMPVFQTLVMGGEGTVPSDRSDQPQGAPQQSEKPSVTGALGSALGGRFGLGRKKQTQQDSQPSSTQGQSGSAAGALIEMTTELKGFSAAPVDSALFEVPAGFTKIQHPEYRGAKQ